MLGRLQEVAILLEPVISKDYRVNRNVVVCI